MAGVGGYELIMKLIAASLVVPVLVASFPNGTMAGPYKKRAHAGLVRQATVAARPSAVDGYTGYYEHILDKVPFGSQLWWRIYESQPKGR
jgi:hypothetical protein